MNLMEYVNKSSKMKEDFLVETFEEICDELKELARKNGAEWVKDFLDFGCLDVMVDYEAEDGFGSEGFKKGEL